MDSQNIIANKHDFFVNASAPTDGIKYFCQGKKGTVGFEFVLSEGVTQFTAYFEASLRSDKWYPVSAIKLFTPDGLDAVYQASSADSIFVADLSPMTYFRIRLGDVVGGTVSCLAWVVV